jgi:phenylacetate-coenzyme A ligase PaaK-like adenylate-forming protein
MSATAATTTGTTTAGAFGPLRDQIQEELLAGYPAQLARLRWDRATIVAHQRQRLRALLAYAVERSPFHARRLAKVDMAAVDPRDLSQLPVMTKAEMMADLGEVFTDARLTVAAVEEALAAATTEPAVPLSQVVAMASGGSSGERGVFVFDRPGVVQYVHLLTRGLVARITAAGGPPPGGLPIAMVGAASPVHATAFAQHVTAGSTLPFRIHTVPVTLPLAEIVRRLEELQAPVLYGYPSMLARLAVERRAGRLRITPRMVTACSETCLPELRAAITVGFGVPLVDAFGSTEGLVGASPPDDEVLAFAEDECIVELVDGDYRPVAPGTPSARVLVTNLFNRLQPLIRYELTDRFVAQPPGTAHGYLRARVHGRADESFFYPGGMVVHPLVVRSVLVQSPDVLEYQVRQTPRGVELIVVAAPGLDLETLRARLTRALAGAGLSHPEVTVRTAQRLDRHPQTGKLARFVPLDRAGA